MLIIDQADVSFLDRKVRADRGLMEPRTGMFFKRELEFVRNEAIKSNLPTPNAFRLFPRITDVPRGAETHTQYIWESTGEAIIISDFAADLPRVGVTKKKLTRPLYFIGDSYGYNYQQILAAQFAGQPLDRLKGAAAREVIERKHNSLTWWGDEASDVWGLFTHPHITRYLFANPIDDGTDAGTIISEVGAFLGIVEAITDTAADVDTLVLPPEEYAYLKNTPRSSGSDKTLYDWILETHDNLRRIEKSWECKPEYNNGVAMCVAYRSDPTVVGYVAPQLFQQHTMERKSLEFGVPCTGINGGFYSRRPLEVVVGELKRG